MRIIGNKINWEKKNINLHICLGLLVFSLITLFKFNYCLETISAKNYNPFLLEYSNSTKEAEIKIIIWFRDQNAILDIKNLLPSKNWYWEESFRNTATGIQATSLVGQTKVDKSGEQSLKKWYFAFADEIKSAGGQVYLDERIAENIDIAAYLSKVGAAPKQWMLDNSTISVAALKSGFGNDIQAGNDQVNVQLLTHFSKGNQQSVLALPTLIEEF